MPVSRNCPSCALDGPANPLLDRCLAEVRSAYGLSLIRTASGRGNGLAGNVRRGTDLDIPYLVHAGGLCALAAAHGRHARGTCIRDNMSRTIGHWVLWTELISNPEISIPAAWVSGLPFREAPLKSRNTLQRGREGPPPDPLHLGGGIARATCIRATCPGNVHPGQHVPDDRALGVVDRGDLQLGDPDTAAWVPGLPFREAPLKSRNTLQRGREGPPPDPLHLGGGIARAAGVCLGPWKGDHRSRDSVTGWITNPARSLSS